MKCDIIIPVWNQLETTKECIENLIAKSGYPFRLIIVDNGSSEPTRRYLESLKSRNSLEVVLIRNEENLGYIKAVNQGLKISSAPYVCLLNNDTIPSVGWLEKMITFAERHKDIGLMNPFCDGHGKLSIDEYAKLVANNGDEYMEMNQCFGFCKLIKREVIEKIGYLDESFGIGGYDDTDYSMRAFRVGYKCASVHSSYVYHKQHISFKAMGAKDSSTVKGRQEYFKKWPRHLRIGIILFADQKKEDEEIENALKAVLFLAREWCWINFWIFGKEEEARKRIGIASLKIAMPSHQNIKYNYLPTRFSLLQVLVRLIERNFGTKKRKKYDIIFTLDPKIAVFLKAFSFLHDTAIGVIKADDGIVMEMKRNVYQLRNPKV